MWKRTTLTLTLTYSLIFLTFLAIFSGGLYFWVNRSFSDGFAQQVRGQVEQNNTTELSIQQSDTASTAAEIAVNNFRDILIVFDVVAFFCVPFLAYFLTRRLLIPLKLSQEKQQQFIANASHELRTPLAVISGELELSLRKTHSIDEYKKTLLRSQREVDHMTRLTKELLLLAQLDELHDKVPDISPIILSSLLHSIRKHVVTVSERKTVEMHIICPKDVVIMGNDTLINVAISNLVDNAIKYSPHGGKVAITAHKLAQNHVQLSIHNQGQAIDIAHQSQLFDRFYQIKNGRNGEGFGLGLAIVKKIITLHNGKISVSSSDQGTRFNIVV